MAFKDGVQVRDEVKAELVDFAPETHQITVNTTTGRVQCSCGAEWVWVANIHQTCPNDK